MRDPGSNAAITTWMMTMMKLKSYVEGGYEILGWVGGSGKKPECTSTLFLFLFPPTDSFRITNGAGFRTGYTRHWSTNQWSNDSCTSKHPNELAIPPAPVTPKNKTCRGKGFRPDGERRTRDAERDVFGRNQGPVGSQRAAQGRSGVGQEERDPPTESREGG